MLRIVMSLSCFSVPDCCRIPAGFGKGHTIRRLAADKTTIIQGFGWKFTKNKNTENCQAAGGRDWPVAAIDP
jgi:hypothetical protein